jgi:hypothetical protein
MNAWLTAVAFLKDRNEIDPCSALQAGYSFGHYCQSPLSENAAQ